LFGAHKVQYQPPPQDLLQELLQNESISSIQVTFHADRKPSAHAMPPGGFRLAIINGFDFEAARSARERLALSFWSTQQLLPRRGRNARSAE